MEEVCLFKSNLFSNLEIINKTFFCENKEETFCGHLSDIFLFKKAFFFFIEIVSIINLSYLFHSTYFLARSNEEDIASNDHSYSVNVTGFFKLLIYMELFL